MIPLLAGAAGGAAVLLSLGSRKRVPESVRKQRHRESAETARELRGLLEDVRLVVVETPQWTAVARIVDAARGRWQITVQNNFDRTFGSKRQSLSSQLSDPKEIPEPHQNLNNQLGTVALLSCAAGASSFYPPMLLVTIPFYAAVLAPMYRSAYQDLRLNKRLSFNILATIFATGIPLTGSMLAGALSMCAGTVFQKIELSATQVARARMQDAFGSHPRIVLLWRDGEETEIPYERIREGDQIVVHAGQVIPVDGLVEDGMGMVDQHRLTGESRPVEREPHAEVLASTLLLAGTLRVRAQKAGQDTLAGEIARTLDQTTSHHLGIELKGKRLAERTMTPALAGSVLLAPFLGAGRAVALLGASMPGVELLIAGPISLLRFLNYAAERQILVKDGRVLELLNDVKQVVFDKTGTLTLEQPNVESIHLFGGWSEDEVLRLAAAAERHQAHPIARALLQEASERGLELPEIEAGQYEVGYGIQVGIRKRGSADSEVPDTSPDLVVRVGSGRYMILKGVAVPEEVAQIQASADAAGHSMVFVGIGAQVAGAIELSPAVRPEARAVVQELRKRGISSRIVSGDQEAPTRRLAEELGIEDYHANVLPHAKADLVRELQEKGGSLCFIGDGINDAVALKTAHVSISLLGATTMATDTAQIVFMDRSLRNLPLLIDLAREVDRNLRTSFYLSAGGGFALMGAGLVLHLNVGGVLFFGYSLAAGVLANTMRPVMASRRAEETEKALTGSL